MHLTDHISDVQLNEYLDNESDERVQIEAHLSSCKDCATRLTVLQALFSEIESLSELELTHSIAARFTSTPNLIPQLPRWLTLTATLQVAVAMVAIGLAAPIMTAFLPAIEPPTLTDIWLPIQSQWIMWLNVLSNIQIPQLPELTLQFEISSALMTSVIAGLFMFWVVGNGLLLRKQMK